MTDQPLDLAPIRHRDRWAIARMAPAAPDGYPEHIVGDFSAYRERAWCDADMDRRALLAEVDRLAAELAAERERRYSHVEELADHAVAALALVSDWGHHEDCRADDGERCECERDDLAVHLRAIRSRCSSLDDRRSGR